MFRTLRMAMLSIGLAGTIATLALLAHSLWSFQRLSSSASLALVAKDAVADALPPPLFLIEARVLASQAVEGTVALAAARESVNRLAATYDERLQYWRDSDSNTLPEPLLQYHQETARRMISLIRHAVFDPLAAGDRDAAGRGLMVVNDAYVEHRRAVDGAVSAGRRAAAGAIEDFAATRRAGERLMPALAVILLFGSYLCYRAARRGILQPLHECVVVADRVAAGDFSDCGISARPDEIGQLQRALRDMTAKLSQMRDELVQSRDEAEAAALAKASFLANMSHEIRTPMNAILGLAHLVQRTSLNARQRDYLCKIEESAQSLMRIINDILDFSKIDAGKLELENAPFEIDLLLEQVAQTVAPLIAGKPIEFIVDRADGVCNCVSGDALRLRQVLTNLTSNAAKFTERGEIVVGVRLVAETDASQTLEFVVRDTGIGMSEQEQQRLFQAFTQADSSMTRRYGGTGLGLAISAQLVGLMGGRLQACSDKGRGSLFMFTLDLPRSAQRQAPEDSTQRLLADRLRLTGLPVLVADDNFTARITLSAMLRSFGMQVTEVDGGQAAVAALRRAHDRNKPFAIALLDWRMPDMDGFAVIDALRDSDPAAQTAFVMVSAFERQAIESAVPEHGLNGVLQKPVTASTLLDTLHEALSAGAAVAVTQVPEQPNPVGDALTGHVLLVEDNEINQIVAEGLLEAFGLSVEVAACAQDALQRLQQRGRRAFDLVLMDVQMPGMDGLQATQVLRTLPELSKLPVVALTANALVGERERCLAAGMSDYVPKPIDPLALHACLGRWLAPSP